MRILVLFQIQNLQLKMMQKESVFLEVSFFILVATLTLQKKSSLLLTEMWLKR